MAVDAPAPIELSCRISGPAGILVGTVVRPAGAEVDAEAPLFVKEGVVVLCHGFRMNRDKCFLPPLATALASSESLSSVRFDFRGNGESEGETQLFGYDEEVEDLHSILQCLSAAHTPVLALVGHSRGANVVLRYAYMHPETVPPRVVPVAARFNMAAWPARYLTPAHLSTLADPGSSITWSDTYTITHADLHYITHDMTMSGVATIPPTTHTLIVHGTHDTIIPASDSAYYVNLIPNVSLSLIQSADHMFYPDTDDTAALLAVIVPHLSSPLPLSPRLHTSRLTLTSTSSTDTTSTVERLSDHLSAAGLSITATDATSDAKPSPVTLTLTLPSTTPAVTTTHHDPHSNLTIHLHAPKL